MLNRTEKKIFIALALLTACLCVLLIVSKKALFWASVHVAGDKGIKVLYHDTLWNAALLGDSFPLRFYPASQLAQSSSDYPFYGDIDAAFRWAYHHECYSFVQCRAPHAVIYYRYVLKDLPFSVYWSDRDTLDYFPKTNGWSMVNGDEHGYFDHRGNLHLKATAGYAYSEEADYSHLSDSAILIRLQPLASSLNTDTCQP